VNQIYNWKKTGNVPHDLNEVPWVTGGYPFIGHGIQFGKDIIAFIRRAYVDHGKVFKIKIFRKKIAVICDHEMKAEFFKFKENEMSMYKVLASLYFGDAFAEDPNTLPTIIKLVSSTVKIRAEKFAPKIADEAQRAIQRLKNDPNLSNIDISHEVIKFIACTSARCFIGVELTDDFFNTFERFTYLVNKIVVLTYFFPKSLLRFVFNPFLKRYRPKSMNICMKKLKSTWRI
jgi:hypothetical protein